MQPWHRWREPLAVVLIVALGLMLVVRGVALFLAYDAGNTGGLLGSIPGGDDLLVLATAAAVLWCASAAPEPSERSWPIAVAGAVVVGLTVAIWVALSVWDVVALVSWPTPDIGFVLYVAEGLLRLAVPGAALAAVIQAVRRAAADRREAGVRTALPSAGSDRATAEPEDGPAVEAAPERLPAAWQADEATGTVWLTADDAAQGRPGLSWSDPAGESGQLSSGWTAQAAIGSEAETPTGSEGENSDPGPPAHRRQAAAEDDDLR